MTQPVIRLDKTKPFSFINGERSPMDPHYSAHFMQDTLFFDATGILVPDDGRTEPYLETIEDEDGARQIKRYPLYPPAMRDKVAKRLAQMKDRTDAREQVANTGRNDIDGDDDASTDAGDVNLESWLRGEAKYPPFKIFQAYQERFKKKSHDLSAVAEDLIYDERILGEDQVAPDIMRLVGSKVAVG